MDIERNVYIHVHGHGFSVWCNRCSFKTTGSQPKPKDNKPTAIHIAMRHNHYCKARERNEQTVS